MANSAKLPPLKSLHPDTHLDKGKVAKMDRVSSEDLLASLVPGQQGALKTRPDGTILDGHHRVCILRRRGVDVDRIPREVIERDPA